MGIENDVHWSENSKFFSTPIIQTNLDNGGYFIYDIEEKKFATIPVEHIWVLESLLTNTFFEIAYRDDQIPYKNENEYYPTEIFLKSESIRVKLDELLWHKLDEINAFEQIYKSKQVIAVCLIDKEFRPFKEEFPLSTDIKIWDVEQFAEYGDEQSKIWINEID